ncbi:MAG: hypothetical protein Q9218_007173 [Villophora microphyllina]
MERLRCRLFSITIYLLSFSRCISASIASPATARGSTTPAPIVVPASQSFEGIDGPWSSFTLQIGSPAQDVNVFISTAGYQTLVVAPEGCTSSDAANCAQLRGGIFNRNQSTTWDPNTFSPNKTGTFALGLEENLGYSANGEFGFDKVALGWQGSGGPSLNHQVVAGIADKHFYLGMFGLNPRPSNFSEFNVPISSYMSNLKIDYMIPSLSWAYTAGNQYRLNKVLGSLILGGYDASRFVPNNLTIPFNQQDIRDLTVNINGISMVSEDHSQQAELLTESIAAFVDSTIADIYLPLEVCKRFEDAFGIEWNEGVQGYLVNDSLHDSLSSKNPSVTFTISSSSSTSSPAVNITLPYAAFDLTAQPPLMRNPSRYFPLMRATNESQYRLGRTFLQEAYLIADYERRNFSISQCSWVENAAQKVVAIHSPVNATASTPSRSFAPGAIAGTSIGSIVAVSALVFLLYHFVIRQRRRKQTSTITENIKDSSESSIDPDIQEKPQEIDGDEFKGHEADGKALPGLELDSNMPAGQELDGKVDESEMEGSRGWAQELGIRDIAPSELAG